MSEEELKRILLTTGYTTQTDKDAIYIYINQLKEVIEEVREYIEKHHSGNLKITFGGKLLQILDKVKEN